MGIYCPLSDGRYYCDFTDTRAPAWPGLRPEQGVCKLLTDLGETWDANQAR
jgi:hypothetical protein